MLIPELELEVFLATDFRARLVGLAGLHRDEIRPLLIPRCKSIHTIGMRCAIDAIFLRSQERLTGGAEIVALHDHLGPGQIKTCRSADSVLEIWSGGIDQLDLTVGQNFVFDHAIIRRHGGEFRLPET